MADNDQLLQQIGNLIDQKLEPVYKQFKIVNRKLNRVQKDIELVLRYHDEMYLHQQKRIERIEKHVGLPTSE